MIQKIGRNAKRLRKARREELKQMAENREKNRDSPPALPIRYHIKPVISANYSDITRGTIHANNFELKSALIHMVQQNQFGGAATSEFRP